jgi:hypothetical protein
VGARDISSGAKALMGDTAVGLIERIGTRSTTEYVVRSLLQQDEGNIKCALSHPERSQAQT